MRALLAHPGTQYSGKLAAQLFQNGALGEFHTGIAIAEGGIGDHILSVLPPSWRRRLANRRVRQLPRSHLRIHPWDEALAIFLRGIGGPQQSVLHSRNARFQKRISDRAIERVNAVVGFDTSGWILAERCARMGVPFVLDQSIGHPDSKNPIFRNLRKRYPLWSDDADVRLQEVREAEQIEHELAVRIVVASSFTRKTLIENGVVAEKIRLNPYGVDCARFRPQVATQNHGMRFCYVGSISARKGVPQLLEAWQALRPKDAELWLIGPAGRATARLIQGYENVTYKGAVPQDELPSLLNQCDAFVFPSFFEGFAQVILEAMACGLPVITTTATAGPDIIKSGQDGWVIDPGDDAALVAALEHCLRNPDVVKEAGVRARRVAETFTWERYGERWLRVLAELTPAAAAR